MAPVKRQLFTPSKKVRPTKRAKTTGELTRDVAVLSRQVNANKPEIRQQFYTISLTPLRATPIPILLPTNIAGDEIKLHRVTVGWSSPDDTGSGDFPWGMLYSPKEGYSETDGLPNGTNANSIDNILGFPDNTKTRVWQRSMVDIRQAGYRDTGTTFNAGGFMLDKKFSIPMKVGMDSPNEVTPTVTHNQIYLVTSQVPESGAPRTLRVTIWYTDA